MMFLEIQNYTDNLNAEKYLNNKFKLIIIKSQKVKKYIKVKCKCFKLSDVHLLLLIWLLLLTIKFYRLQ